jgi:hypothetical protein
VIPRWKQSLIYGRAEPAPPRNQNPDKGNQRLQRRDASISRDADITGVRSPPLRGGPAEVRWPYGEGQEMAPKAVFSEARGLRVRIAGPDGWQGLSLPPEVTQEAGNLNGKRLGRTQAFSSQPDGDRDLGCFLRRGLEVFGNGSDISPPLFLDLHEMGLIFDTMCAKVPIIIMSVCQVSGLS